MKKLFFTTLMALICLVASAVPAIPTPQKVTQPNGEELTVRIKGDEFYHYTTTVDGYTIVMNEQGYFTYGTLVNDEVVASKLIARDAEKRSASDMAWLAATGKNLRSESKVAEGIKARAKRDALPHLNTINYNNFRGLVILVEFKDAHFTRSDVVDFYTNMINQENYTGYTNEDGTSNPYGRFTGSVRDYFHDNSNGIFVPQFDVVGPFEVNYSVDQGDYAYNIFMSAIQKANPTVDFSQYDLDNNGAVDLVYFIYADTPSSSDSSSPNHIWPHRSSFYTYTKYDGKYIRDYACSAEYIYAKSNGIFDGIGTICHEFSHVLGLPDLYDTYEDDNDTNGEAQHPGEWDLMAGGNYQNNARTPVAYSLYDRYSTGFANYQVITAEGEYTLNPTSTTGEGYILKSPTTKEVFLIDNRQTSTKWDAYAPGHGMTIARMDSTNNSVWTGNAPNGNANRLYYELLRAGGSTAFQSPTDPFPGTRGVAMVTNDTKANLMAWGNKPNQYNLYNIHEEGDVVKFSVKLNGTFVTEVEDFEPMTPKTSNNSSISDQGSLATWTLAKCFPASPTDNTLCNGEKAIAMKKPSTATMTSDVAYDTYMVTFDFYNPTNVNASLQLYMSTDQGQTWTVQPNVMGNTTVLAGLNTKSTLYYPINVQVPARYRVACTGGATSVAGYLDDFTIYHNGEIVSVEYDVNVSNVIEHGTVVADKQTAAEGETVTLTVTPDEGYELETLTVMSGSTAVATTPSQEVGKFTFVMPAAPVAINAIFSKIIVVVPGDVDGDGTVTAADVTALYNFLLNNDSTGLVNGDQDGDGYITSGDITLVYNVLLGN